MQPSTPRNARHAPSGVQSLQALRVDVKFFDSGSSSSFVAADVRRL
jgi:hypothetical protein